MNLNSLKPMKGSRSRKLRVGRGRASGKGKTCGRGHKGQMARSGHKHKLAFEGGQMPLARRLPKRGFNNRNRVVYIPVNVASLELYENGAEITPETLRKSGLVKGPVSRVKILGSGELKKKLQVKAHAFSGLAQEKIQAAGGSFEVLS